MSAIAEIGTFDVNRGVDGGYLHRILTRDISTLESVHDLVDNAIDAARNRLLAEGKSTSDRYGLPDDYSAFVVSLRFGPKSISIMDNCRGIEPETLSTTVFVTGSESHHPFGIGYFGIGLKRALLRLGMNFWLHTDTGRAASRMSFTSSELGGSGTGTLLAAQMRTRGIPRTLVHISGLPASVRHETSSAAWRGTLVDSLSRRYGRYIGKGLRLVVNGKTVPGYAPGFRVDGPVPQLGSNFTTIEGVQVFVDAGMHEAYRLTHESDYVKDEIGQLTDQYGWYFVCNDRVVRVASHEAELGWSTNWHQEYYGFIGWVHFVDPDVKNLPWDTKKTSIDAASSVFRQVADKLQSFAEEYKTANKRAKKVERDSGETPEKQRTATQSAGRRQSPHRSTGGDHNDRWTTLLPPLSHNLKSPKLSALLDEAGRLRVEDCYAGSMLMRTVFEHAIWERLKAEGKLKNVKQAVFDAQAKDGRPFTEDQKRKFKPTLRQMADWLGTQPDFFPEDTRRECVAALRKFMQHLPELNGIAHEGTLTDSGKLKIMRNDTIHLLMVLLGG